MFHSVKNANINLRFSLDWSTFQMRTNKAAVKRKNGHNTATVLQVKLHNVKSKSDYREQIFKK